MYVHGAMRPYLPRTGRKGFLRGASVSDINQKREWEAPRQREQHVQSSVGEGGVGEDAALDWNPGSEEEKGLRSGRQDPNSGLLSQGC